MSIRKRTKKYRGVGYKRKLSKLEKFLGYIGNIGLIYNIPRYKKVFLESFIRKKLADKYEYMYGIGWEANKHLSNEFEKEYYENFRKNI
ncbi:MAG: hypothetical protein ACRC1T_09505 [Clostridium chrysemydis]|uniref:hypothetical protein n=1 Tax=Clostridium chrysemydis TaxID=2665504 RepID=UPI003F3A7856